MAEAVSCDAGAITGGGIDSRFAHDRRPQRTENGARLHERAEDVRRQPKGPHQIDSPAARVRIEHLTGAGVGVFVDLDASEEVVEQIRHEQQGLGRVQQRRAIALHRQELKKRVETHELDAGVAEDLVARHASKGLLHDAFGMRIAVVAGIAQQTAVASQQREIDAPGIDAQAVQTAVEAAVKRRVSSIAL